MAEGEGIDEKRHHGSACMAVARAQVTRSVGGSPFFGTIEIKYWLGNGLHGRLIFLGTGTECAGRGMIQEEEKT